jgi:general secretion pathway protein D
VVTHRRAVGACVAAGLVFGLLTGCYPLSSGESRPHMPDPFDTVLSTNLDPRYPQPIEQSNSPTKKAAGASFYGHEAAAPNAPATPVSESGEGYELNFENAPVTTVAKLILGDILGVGYTIDPRVQGTVTIASGRPVPKRDLVLVLENALRMGNIALVGDAGGGYRLIPSAEAQGNGATTVANDLRGGYGISVVPLRYTSAQTILKLLDNFAIKPGMARADSANNLMLVQGSASERRLAVEAILSFDVDWMRGQSVGIYPLENAAPEEVIKELDKIMASGEGGLNQALVTLQPVTRLNALLVVTRKPSLLRETAAWIRRLDQANNAGASVHVYRLRYGDARQIARVLSDLFGSRSQGLDSAVNQIAPGTGAYSASSSAFAGMGASGSPAGSGLSTGATTAGGGSGLGAAAGGSTGNAGIQLGNLGSGLGNPQGLGGAASGGTSPNIQQGAFGGGNGQGPTALALPGLRIAADVTNNSLVIYASQENYRLIERTLTQLDRPQLQVAIHATIAEVTLNNNLQFGVEYYLQGSSIGVGFNTLIGSGANSAASASAATTTGSTAAVSQMLSAVLPGANLLLGASSNPWVVINALRTVTDVKVLSSPSVVVLDNQLATMLVGDQVPVETATANVLAATTSTSSTVVNSINYINTGVILRVLPRVNINGNVILDVEQEVSGVENNANAASLTPTVSQRQIKSSIAVASGQTVLLGGLITETQQRSRNGIPVLEELPGGVGNLFSNDDRSMTRTEIIIFIEPQIIRNGTDAAKVAEELRAKLRGSADSAFPPGPSLHGDPHFVQ